jgi:putative hemolysin
MHSTSAVRPHRAAPVVAAKGKGDALRFSVSWAESAEDLREAQRLRYRVFVTEMGATLTPPAGTPEGLDADYFDAFCDHLLVRAVSHDDQQRGQLVGTYRVLAPAAAQRAGGFYADTEFDLAPLAGLRAQAVELGRACVDPDWRSGGVIMALWGALGQYMLARRLDTMIGCASISLADGGRSAGQLWGRLRQTHLVAPAWRVRPFTPLEFSEDELAPDAGHMPDTPPLIKGYLRCGARLLGPPAYDAAFNTADLPMMMRLADLPERHREHFLNG